MNKRDDRKLAEAIDEAFAPLRELKRIEPLDTGWSPAQHAKRVQS